VALPVMLLVLLGAALHAAWNGLVKSGADRYLDLASLLAAAALLTLLWLPFLPAPARACWPYLAVSAVIHQVYYALIAVAYRKGEMSLVYPVMRGVAPALTAAASVLAIGEFPSAIGLAGVCCVSGGVLLLAFEHARRSRVDLTPLLVALANGAVIAAYTIVDGMGARLSGHALSYTSWGFLLCGTLFVPTAALLRRRELAPYMRARWRTSLVGAACSIASYGVALWAMTRAPIATVAALRETSIIFGVVVAAVALKERVGPLRAGAVGVVLVGAILIKLG
jgi:drug/metabolite transporter (DMT)-like permease